MVFYFSGTGNSLYIARRLAKDTNEQLVSIAECMLHNQYEFTLKDDEKIGYVYPVIACAPPDIVTDFMRKVRFHGYTDQYIYSVLNCAGTPEYTSRIMKETGEKSGYPVCGFYEVLMPGNYITKKQHLPEEKVQQYLKECDAKIDAIECSIRKKERNYKKEKHSYLLSYGLHKLAVLEKTEKFIFGDECVKCGKCADICSMCAISLKDGCYIRDEKRCAFCLACVNVCPTRALQVGKKTQGNPQYLNPYYNGKARG